MIKVRREGTNQKNILEIIFTGNFDYVFPQLKQMLVDLDKETEKLSKFEEASLSFRKGKNKKKYHAFIGSFGAWVHELQRDYFENQNIMIVIPEVKQKALPKRQQALLDQYQTEQNNEIQALINKDLPHYITYKHIDYTAKIYWQNIKNRISKIIEIERKKNHIQKYWWLGTIFIAFGLGRYWLELIGYIKNGVLAILAVLGLYGGYVQYDNYQQQMLFDQYIAEAQKCPKDLACVVPPLTQAYKMDIAQKPENRQILDGLNVKVLQPLVKNFNETTTQKQAQQKPLTDQEKALQNTLSQLSQIRRKLKNSLSAEEYFALGNQYAYSNPSLAIQFYDSAIVKNPNDADTYNNRGVLYNTIQKYDLALIDYNKAIQLNPNYANAYNNRGILYSLQEKEKRALALIDYNKAIQLNPNDGSSYSNRAIIKIIINDFKGACADAQKAKSLGYKKAYLEAFIKQYCPNQD